MRAFWPQTSGSPLANASKGQRAPQKQPPLGDPAGGQTEARGPHGAPSAFHCGPQSLTIAKLG